MCIRDRFCYIVVRPERNDHKLVRLAVAARYNNCLLYTSHSFCKRLLGCAWFEIQVIINFASFHSIYQFVGENKDTQLLELILVFHSFLQDPSLDFISRTVDGLSLIHISLCIRDRNICFASMPIQKNGGAFQGLAIPA